MGKFYSIALHDLRVSEGKRTILTIENLRKRLQVPLTIHLIFDADLTAQPRLLAYLQEQVQSAHLEIVFHGLKHSCSKNISKILVFFHKYQAEYLEDDEYHRAATKESFTAIEDIMKVQVGICPPCWLANSKNMALFHSLDPLYIETLLYMHYRDHKVISPVISLGSPNRFELIFLKIQAYLIYSLSVLFFSHIRIAIHLSDLKLDASQNYFKKIVSRLNKRGFKPLLLRELHS